jgi:hypothetical protein
MERGTDREERTWYPSEPSAERSSGSARGISLLLREKR